MVWTYTLNNTIPRQAWNFLWYKVFANRRELGRRMISNCVTHIFGHIFNPLCVYDKRGRLSVHENGDSEGDLQIVQQSWKLKGGEPCLSLWFLQTIHKGGWQLWNRASRTEDLLMPLWKKPANTNRNVPCKHNNSPRKKNILNFYLCSFPFVSNLPLITVKMQQKIRGTGNKSPFIKRNVLMNVTH